MGLIRKVKLKLVCLFRDQATYFPYFLVKHCISSFFYCVEIFFFVFSVCFHIFLLSFFVWFVCLGLVFFLVGFFCLFWIFKERRKIAKVLQQNYQCS